MRSRIPGRWAVVALLGLVVLWAGGVVVQGADPLAGWHPVELAWQVRFQGTGQLAPWMRVLSALGPGTVLTALVAVLFFGYDARWATRLAVLLFTALWLREVLALALQSPRPFWIEPRLQSFGDSAVKAARFGLPSGHALVAAAFWFRLAAEVRRGVRAAWLVAGLIVASIAVSRVYLGVHFLSDVVTGVTVGTLWCAAFRAGEDRVAGWWVCKGRGTQAVWALGAGLAMGFVGVAVRALFVSEPLPAAWGEFGAKAVTVRVFFEVGGTLAGLGLGIAMLGGWAGAGGPWWQRLLRIAVAGVVAKWGLRDPLGLLLSKGLGNQPESIRCGAEFVAGMLQGWAAWGGVPWLFLRLGWARFDEGRAAAAAAGEPAK